MAGLLFGKVALVSGIGPGLGGETALAFAREGAAVLLMARSEMNCTAIAERIRQAGGRAEIVLGDVVDDAACAAAVERATLFGGLDILVANAFYQGEQAPPTATRPDDWRQVFDVNLLGPLALARAAAPAMAARGGGSIVMVASDQAWRVVPGFAAYSASKAALVALTRHLATELGRDQIRVNAVHPGLIMGPPVEGFLAHLAQQQGVSYQQVHDGIAAQAALGRITGPEEIADTLLYFASDLSRAVTGQSLAVDAGAYFH